MHGEPEPSEYTSKPLHLLTFKERQQIKKNMQDAVYQNFDDFSETQANTPELRIGRFHRNLLDNGVNPDHAVRFLSADHLGTKTAASMGGWFSR